MTQNNPQQNCGDGQSAGSQGPTPITHQLTRNISCTHQSTRNMLNPFSITITASQDGQIEDIRVGIGEANLTKTGELALAMEVDGDVGEMRG
eukprot:scaffold5045_cov71-Cyclotella_meneghiniana.AAC.6